MSRATLDRLNRFFTVYSRVVTATCTGVRERCVPTTKRTVVRRACYKPLSAGITILDSQISLDKGAFSTARRQACAQGIRSVGYCQHHFGARWINKGQLPVNPNAANPEENAG
jgi:hypothetical protein